MFCKSSGAKDEWASTARFGAPDPSNGEASTTCVAGMHASSRRTAK
jgi:hypothetical protein